LTELINSHLAPARTKRLYHFLHACHAIKDLKKNSIKLSRYGDVNDTQELEACCFPGYEDNREQLTEFVKKTFRFLCLTPEISSEHLWKEYGDESKGMCFALDVSNESIYPVDYVPKGDPKRIELPLNLKQQYIEARRNNDKAREDRLDSAYIEKLRHVCTTKYDVHGYKHENEERIFFNESLWRECGNLHFSDFNNDSLVLKEVILGKHCQETEEFILSLVKTYPGQPVSVRRHVA
jgi:hypothetical protein